MNRTYPYGERETELVTPQLAKSASSISSSARKQTGAAQRLVGIDEVGRGAWAGPVVAAAVILAEPIAGLKDSKLLTKAQREKLAKLIHEKAESVSLGWAEPSYVDEFGLTRAVAFAMQQALGNIRLTYSQIIIDGNYNFLAGNPLAFTKIKADQTVPAVSAASIVAKVARDRYMAAASAKYPHYFFEKHVGYGTQAHLRALKSYGKCELHRLSFKPVSALL